MILSSWDMLCEEIKNIVQNAVDSRNFCSLNRSVKDTLSRRFSLDIPPLLFKNIRWLKIVSVLMTAIGGLLSFSMLFPLSVLFLFYLMYPAPARILAGAVLTFLLVGGAVLGSVGAARLLRLKRFRIYIEELGTRGYFEVRTVSSRLHKPVQYIVRDLKSLIRRRWFLEGHLDRQEMCFMASDDVYRQYCLLMEHIDAVRRKENEEKENQLRMQKKQEGMDPKVRSALQAGEGYIQRIKECNARIPGEEISAKISKIEDLAHKIFDRVEKNPACLSDIKKLMDYYLPTTVKLLDAYAELDAFPAQGENISSSKKEIEDTLDTLNIAFTKLLDSLFREEAWDVSSDISALKTMLAQEGLTKKDFRK